MTKKQMTKEEKKRWAKAKFVKALRSGRYKKANERCAKYDEGNKICYCAVGVFGKIMRIPVEAPSEAFERESYRAIETILGIETKEIFGRNDGWREYGGEPWSFKQIADWVEENV